MSPGRLHARLALEIRDKELAEKYASELERLGFSIVRVGGRGVSFEGERELFESRFQCEIDDSSGSVRFVREPRLPEALSRDVASVYFPTPPTYFGTPRGT